MSKRSPQSGALARPRAASRSLADGRGQGPAPTTTHGPNVASHDGREKQPKHSLTSPCGIPNCDCEWSRLGDAQQGAPKGHRLGQEGHNCNPPTTIEEIEDACWGWRAAKAEKLMEKATPWHRARASGLGRGYTDRLAECGHGKVTAITDQGEVFEAPIGCQQDVCDDCRRKRTARLAMRLKPVVEAHHEHQVKRNRRLTLLTLTVRDSGNLEADRKRITKAWARWRAWWHKRYGWSFTFAFVWEVTPGDHGTGHVHAHVIAWLPRFWKWSAGQAAWKRAADGDGNIDFAKRGDNATAKQAVAYLTKYVSKGVHLGGMPVQVAAEWLGACYGKRRFSCSRKFWRVVRERKPTFVEVTIDLGEDGPPHKPNPRWWTKAKGPP